VGTHDQIGYRLAPNAPNLSRATPCRHTAHVA
jgi:hypothetical protein